LEAEVDAGGVAMSLVQQVIDYLESRPNGATIHEIRAAIAHPRAENGLYTAAKSRHILHTEGRWYRTGKPRVQKLKIEERGVGELDTIRSAEKRFAELMGSARYEDVRFKKTGETHE
jgi:hypothetical protein